MSIWYRRIFCLVAIYTLQRLLFIVFNLEALRAVNLLDWLVAIADGIRFDLCAIATINAPIILSHYLGLGLVRLKPPLSRGQLLNATNFVVFVVFLVTNIPAVLFGIIDSRLFSFTGRRINLNFLEIMGDVREQAWGLLTQYWWLTLLGFIASLAIIIFTRDADCELRPIRSKRNEITRVFLWLTMAGVIIRGGLLSH